MQTTMFRVNHSAHQEWCIVWFLRNTALIIHVNTNVG